MKRLLLLLASSLMAFSSATAQTICPMVAGEEDVHKYYPDGTKWTEIRLDTLKYNSWYSRLGDEWVPNFETIEYYVQGEFVDKYGDTYKCVYTNGPEWKDSLTLLVHESNGDIEVTVLAHEYDGSPKAVSPCEVYQFDWSVGQGLYFKDICESNTTSEYPYNFYYGIIDEIKEGDFGGVRPLKYVDLDGKAPYNIQEPGNTDTGGGRIIQGIGITEWNNGECLFGPPNPYQALRFFDYYYGDKYPERHYRSMLVRFERDDEVLYDVWPEMETVTEEPLPFLEGDPIWVFKYEEMPTPSGSDWSKYWLDAGYRYYTYYFLGGKKEVEGKNYTMMGEVTSNSEGEITLNRWLPVREENGIVYAFTDSLPGVIEDKYNGIYGKTPYLQQGKECVLYNFNTEIGEAFFSPYEHDEDDFWTVESFGTYQLMNGTVCRVLKTHWGYFDLYEKLGFLNRDLEFGIMDPLCGISVLPNGNVQTKCLNVFYQDNTMLYKAPDAPEGLCVNDTIWTSRDDACVYASSYKANPYHEKVMSYIRNLQIATAISFPTIHQESGFFDLQGRRLSGKPARGINILRMSDGTTRKVLIM